MTIEFTKIRFVFIFVLAFTAFLFCDTKAETLCIPNDVMTIEEEAFFGDASLDIVQLPEGVKTIEARAFSESSLTQINLPASLVSVADDAIPRSVHVTATKGTAIYNWALAKGYYIKDTTIHQESPLDWFRFVDNGDGTCTLDLYIGPIPNAEDIVIPSRNANGLIVTDIAKNAFSTYRFTETENVTGKLIIPETVKTIGAYAFGQTQFSGDLIIPDSVVSIGNYAFYGCKGFDGRLIIGNHVQEIGEYAFCACKNVKGDLIIPDSVTGIIETFTFSACTNLTGDLIIGNGVKQINRAAFSDCSFRGVLQLGKGLEIIREEAFTGLKFSGDLIIPDNVRQIGYSAFADCDGFDGKLVLGKGGLNIGSSAFSNCSGLKGDLIFPENGDYINLWSFNGCSGLDGNLYILGMKKDYNSTLHGENFAGCHFHGKMVLACKTVEAPFFSDGNGTFTGNIYMMNTRISGDNCFKDVDAEHIYCAEGSDAWNWFEAHGFSEKLISWEGDISSITDSLDI